MLSGVVFQKVTRGLPEGAARRAAAVARVGARYGFGFVFRRRLFRSRRNVDLGRIGDRLRLSFEELGPNYVELGRFLAGRRDLIPRDIAAELEQAYVPLTPIAPNEVRTILERELGNGLKRLFLEFEETPVRVGVFTQSHRALLPGDRPALVVVNRPGIRRDLLAMRPVADVTRRRIGDQLPVNPSEMVTEFAAQATQRRDLHFAAQTIRRLRELDELPLRIPEVYRDYSTSRCMTLEAPAASAPMEPSAYGGTAGTLIQLAVQEGIFFADTVPERFVATEDGVWFSDPTEVFALDPERMRGIAEVLATVRRGDVEGVINSLRAAGVVFPKDPADLRRELRETLGALGGPLWREHSLEEIRARSLEALHGGHARLPVELTQMMESLVAAEKLGRHSDNPRYVGTIPAAEGAETVISRFRDPAYLIQRTVRRLAQPDTYADYPRQIHSLLNELKDGEIEVQFRHEGLDDLISKVDILANRLVFAVLIAALILGSSMLGIFARSGATLLGVSVFGLAGFVFAAVLGLVLLIGIIRSGRL
ncbi:AarF/ABC1/UbiB kinase family protein [soil metagenome]